jgi:hypothetical protein
MRQADFLGVRIEFRRFPLPPRQQNVDRLPFPSDLPCGRRYRQSGINKIVLAGGQQVKPTR